MVPHPRGVPPPPFPLPVQQRPLQAFEGHRDPPVGVAGGGHGTVSATADKTQVREFIGRDGGKGVTDGSRPAFAIAAAHSRTPQPRAAAPSVPRAQGIPERRSSRPSPSPLLRLSSAPPGSASSPARRSPLLLQPCGPATSLPRREQPPAGSREAGGGAATMSLAGRRKPGGGWWVRCWVWPAPPGGLCRGSSPLLWRSMGTVAWGTSPGQGWSIPSPSPGAVVPGSIRRSGGWG